MIRVGAALAALLACTSPSPPPAALHGPAALHADGRYAMGTVLEIRLPADRRDELEPLFARAARLERIFTRFDPESELSRLNRAAGHGPRAVSPELAVLLADSIGYQRLTRGSFDVTVGPLVELWTEAARRDRAPDPDELAAALARVGTRHLRSDRASGRAELLRAGAAVDLGGVAKGFALDDLAARLRARGVQSALLSFGQSSVAALGRPPDAPRWRLALRGSDDRVAGVIGLRDASLSVSGSLGQALEIRGVTYGHLIDPRSGWPLRRRGVAAVIADSGARAEALGKALLILPRAEALELIESLPDADALLIDADGRRHATRGWHTRTDFRVRAQEPTQAMR